MNSSAGPARCSASAGTLGRARIRGASKPWILAVLLLATVALAYSPAWNGRPIWDDDAHLTRPELRSLSGLARIWTDPGATQQYYPFVHTVFWFEHQLFGDATLPYHLINISLHFLGALLLWCALLKLKIPGAALAAALFALHPLQVESVAWISELKNTLSGVFFFSALLFYLQFHASRQRLPYFLAFLLFLLGLLCKTVIAPLPAVLLVIFWWQHGKLSLRRDFLPLIPFFAIGVGAGLFTAWVEHRFIGAQGQRFDLGAIERCLIAGRAFWFYFFKLVWPVHLIFIYPRWNVSRSVGWQYLFPLAGFLLLGALFELRKRWRAPLAATLIFGGLLFPALGFINVYPFVFSFVADHFQYLASAAFFALAAAALTFVSERFEVSSTARYASAFLLLALCATLTWRQCQKYTDVETLWRSTLAENSGCWLAHNNLGAALRVSGRLEEAVVHLETAIQLNPQDAEAENNLGSALYQQGKTRDAITHFLRAADLKTNYAAPHTNLGSLYLEAGLTDESLAQLQTAVALDPKDGDVQNNLGNTLLQMGNTSAAIRHYEEAVRFRQYQSKSEQATAHYNLANALAQNEELDQAVAHYRSALELQPNYADAHNNLARALMRRKDFVNAIAHYQTALSLKPQSVLFQNNLAWQLATCPDPAVRNGARALRLAGQANQLSGEQDPVILNTLAAAYAENGQFAKALEIADKALHLAETAGNNGLVEILHQEIALYRTDNPYHRPD